VITAEETLTIDRSDSFATPQSSKEHTMRWRMRLNLAERGDVTSRSYICVVVSRL